jgi:hypothetical protein
MSSTLDDVRDEFYDLIGKIEAGDVTDLDTNWASVASALVKLPYVNPIAFDPASSFQHVLNTVIKACGISTLSGMVKNLVELQEALDLKSHDSIEDDDLEEAQELAGKCEKEFIEFLDRDLAAAIDES